MNNNLALILVLALFLTSPLSAEGINNKWLLIPGIRVGKITANSSEAALIKAYGKQNVKSATIELGEGDTAPGTILFPNEPQKKIEITWKNTTTKSKPDLILIRGRHSIWKTRNGISLGISLKALEKINGKPFSLAGFGWDGEGMIYDFDGGKLCALGCRDEVDRGMIKPRKIYIGVEPNINFDHKAFMILYDQVQGDRQYSSGHPAMQQLNPTVTSISVKLDE